MTDSNNKTITLNGYPYPVETAIDEALTRQIMDHVLGIPVVKGMDIRFEAFGDGMCRMVMPHKPEYNGSFDSFHGGFMAVAADTVACFAIMTKIGMDEVLTTTDLNIRYLSAGLSDLTAEARIIKLGRTLCPVQVDIKDTSGKLVAIAQVTYMRLPAMPTRP